MLSFAVPSFVPTIMAAFAAAVKIDAFSYMPVQDFGNAFSTFIAQNYGAKKFHRIKEGFVAANIIVSFCALLFFTILRFLKINIIDLFLAENRSKTAFDTAVAYLDYMSLVISLLGFKLNIDGVLRGIGRMKVFTVASLVNITIRVSFSNIFAPIIGVQAVWISNPIGWAVSFVLCYIAYKLWYSIHFRELEMTSA